MDPVDGDPATECGDYAPSADSKNEFEEEEPKKICDLDSLALNRKKCEDCDKFFDCQEDFDEHLHQFHSDANAETADQTSIMTGADMDVDIMDKNSDVEKENEDGEREAEVPEEKQFKCDQCAEFFEDETLLKSHLDLHSKSKSATCDICLGNFTTITGVIRHKMRVHDNQKTYECRLCGDVFLSSGALSEHRDSHIQDSLNQSQAASRRRKAAYKCSVCKKSFNRKSKLFNHVDTHREKTSKCEYCDEYFTFLALQTHLKKRHSHEMCGICNESFFDKNAFYAHEKEHFNVQENICDYCSQSFDEQDRLINHMMMEHVGRSEEFKCEACQKVYHCDRHLKNHRSFSHLTCDLCRKSFSRQSHLISHINTVHDPEKFVVCMLCSIVFKTKPLLGLHLVQAHSLRIPYRCSICHRLFKKFTKLTSHVENCHSGKVKYDRWLSRLSCEYLDDRQVIPCEFCLKTYRCHFTLKKHVHMHHNNGGTTSDMKVFTCDSCPKTFFTKAELLTHKTVHSDVRNYTCKICNKAYKSKPNLWQHINVEHKERKGNPVTCEICDKTFKCELYLKIHLNRHKLNPGENDPAKAANFDANRKYSCKICGLRYTTSQVLRKHMKRVHFEKKVPKCDICHVDCESPTKLKAHLYKNHKELLPASFIEKHNLKIYDNDDKFHFPDSLEIKQSSLTCLICNETFLLSYDLTQHMKTVHDMTDSEWNSFDNRQGENSGMLDQFETSSSTFDGTIVSEYNGMMGMNVCDFDDPISRNDRMSNSTGSDPFDNLSDDFDYDTFTKLLVQL